MKVILQQDIKGKGKKGQLIDVSDGYARNYLIPKKLAVEASTDNLNTMKQQEAALKRRIEIETNEAKETAEKLSSLTVIIPAKAGAGGKLFGSITNKEIAEELNKQHGINIDKHKIILDDPIKNYGTYTIKAKLYTEISGSFYVQVIEDK